VGIRREARKPGATIWPTGGMRRAQNVFEPEVVTNPRPSTRASTPSASPVVRPLLFVGIERERVMRRRSAAVGSAVMFIVGPGLVLGVVTWLLTRWQFRDPTPHWAIIRVLGVLFILAGLVVLIRAFVRFVTEGFGTPLPAAPPTHLVVGGLYRWVRNPMYVAMLAVIVGQALLFGQLGPLVYAAILWAAAACVVRWHEEPILARRFGAEYDAYRHAVPAWWPRLRPWTPAATPPQ
jgi:protein-S-isoprenylcysteine O-methyltransferase Ste14